MINIWENCIGSTKQKFSTSTLQKYFEAYIFFQTQCSPYKVPENYGPRELDPPCSQKEIINIWGNCIGSTKQNYQPQPCKNILRPTYFPRHNVPPVKCLKIITNPSPVHNMQTYPARKLGGGLIRKQLINGEYIKQISKKTGWGSHPPRNQNVKSPNTSGSITLIRKLRFLTSHLQ